MAVLTRRTWATLLTEHQNRMGRSGDSTYQSRAKEFLAAAYLDICTTWHHYELDALDTSTFTLSTSTNALDISSLGLLGVFSVQIRDPDSDAFLRDLDFDEAHFLFKRFKNLQRQPSSYTRHKDSLYFDVVPDKAYPLTLYYYADPTAPDYDTPTSSQLSREWDEHVLELSIAMAHQALYNVELGAQTQARFEKWAERVTNPLLVAIPIHGRPERQTKTMPHGGAQG